jgi:cytochrome c biogenesis protein CcdA
VTLGLIAGFVGEQTLVVLQKSWIVSIAGLILLFLGILTLTGKGFSSIFKFDHRFKNDIPGVFLMGMAFALGWTACLGPILAGILGIGAILGNPLQSGILLFFYSLGNLLPLFIFSFFYDRFHLSENKYIKGKVIEFSLFKKKYEVHTTNLISGLLFIFLGLIMIIFGGTGKVNNWDLFNTKQYFYSLQNQLLRWHYANFVGIIILLLLLGIILHTFIKSKKLVRI